MLLIALHFPVNQKSTHQRFGKKLQILYPRLICNRLITKGRSSASETMSTGSPLPLLFFISRWEASSPNFFFLSPLVACSQAIPYILFYSLSSFFSLCLGVWWPTWLVLLIHCVFASLSTHKYIFNWNGSIIKVESYYFDDHRAWSVFASHWTQAHCPSKLPEVSLSLNVFPYFPFSG